MKNQKAAQWLVWIFSVVLVLSEMFPCVASFAASQPKSEISSWTGRYANGEVITESDLAKILKEHKKWIKDKKRGIKKADLRGANLSEVDLQGADLRGIELYRAKMHGAKLFGADLREADLSMSDLSEASLFGAKLNKANLNRANLDKANLLEAILREVDLSGANLSKADLSKADLSKADFHRAIFKDTIFEPRVESIPKIIGIDYASNLFELTYESRPKSLVALREEFKKGGMRKEEREVTFAIKSTERKQLWERGTFTSRLESILLYLFELTCQYGMSPLRSLYILVGVITIFSFIYTALICHKSNEGIWKVWLSEKTRPNIEKKRPELLKFSDIRAFLWGFYFSLISAFSIGWRDLNVGNWISRMQRQEYVLKPTGWARFFSGFQSVLSVYLLALWVLTYFGRPFE